MVMKITLTGVKEAMAAFENVPPRVAQRHLRIALNAAGGILKKAAEGQVPSATGLLKKSLGVKVKIPDASFNIKHHGKPAYVVIGPRRGFVRASVNKSGVASLLSDRKALKRVLGGGKVNTRNPARYAHLVHGGTQSHVVAVRNARVLSNGAMTFGRRVTIKAKPNRFLDRAASQAGPAATTKMLTKLREGFLQEAQLASR